MFRIRLKELRENAGYSQYSFADAFGVSQSAVGSWEAGVREPKFDTMQRLADFFGVTVDYLLGREEKSPRNEQELSIDTLEYALYGEAKNLDEDEKKQLLELAKLMRKKRNETNT